MMIQAFYSGVSGLRTNQFAIDTTADNLANASTVGFRSYSAEFSSLFETTLNTTSKLSSDSVGVGARASGTTMNMQSGSFLLSDKSTDLAIDGDGWFGVQGDGAPLYTRDGAFTFDENRDLITTDGFHVLGTMGENISGETLTSVVVETKLGPVGSQENLSFPDNLTMPPTATTTATFSGNLGVIDEPRSISAGVVDANGTKNNLRLEFTKSALQTPPGIQWDVTAQTTSLDGTTVYDTKTGSLEFDAGGSLLLSSIAPIDNNGTSVAINLGSGYTGVTAINSPASGSSSADGLQAGDLLGYEINQNAEIIATFTNGYQSSVGKIALFHFQNDQGLTKISGSRFQESVNSGKPIYFTDSSGNETNGSLVRSYQLESSNVSYAAGLTELIVFQRAYDANSKSITTADQMMQKALQMDA